MAALAPVLAERHDGAVRASSLRLSVAARTYSAMLSVFGPVSSEEFTGCDQAELLVRWIKNDGTPDVQLLERWTSDLWSAIDDLTAGKMPA